MVRSLQICLCLAAGAIVYLAAAARADYLEVRRAANIKAAPQGSAETLLRVEPGTNLILVTLDQTNGYYNVEAPGSSTTGWVFRTFGRGFRGLPPNFTASDLQGFRDRHLAIGRPEGYFELIREGYAVGYDSRLKIPHWVQYELTRDDLAPTDVERSDDFRSDPEIPAHASARNADYEVDEDGDGTADFAKGHLAPAADMERSDHVMSESFLLTNMVPQVGELFNSSIWLDLERDVRRFVDAGGAATIIAGPVFAPEDRDAEGHRWVRHRVIGEKLVAVPTHLYKIVVDRTDPAAPRVFAVLMPNRDYEADDDYANYRVTVDEIEELTGLDFLRNISESLQEDLESSVAATVWLREGN